MPDAIKKAIMPVAGAAMIAASPFTGGATLAPGITTLGGGLVSDFAGQATPQLQLPSRPSSSLSATSGPPPLPDLPGPAGSGFTTFGQSGGLGQPDQSEALANAIQQAMGGGTGNPFAGFGG